METAGAPTELGEAGERRSGAARAGLSTMQLEFTQAMTDFRTMFPEMEHEVIEAVLRANRGAVDATIDQLLAMSTDNQNERLRLQMERLEKDCTGAETLKSEEESVPLAVQRKWVPLLLGPLPASFLRVEYELEDERIADLLQNEEFVAELRWDPDFMAALDSEQKRGGEEQDFKERLKNMGKISRKKFGQLSRMFSPRPPARAPDRRLLEEHSDDDDRPKAQDNK